MNLAELLILAIGLAMDAFAVAVCKGLSIRKLTIKHPVIVGLYFGIFQAAMPMIGFFLGKQFSDKISAIDHWVAFILLGIIGVNMVRGAIKEEEEEDCGCNETDNSLKVKEMLILSVATSIDALAVGITFAFLKVNIFMAASTIGVVTLLISAAGVIIGNIFGSKLKSKAEMAGGIILVCLGTKILLEHLGIIG